MIWICGADPFWTSGADLDLRGGSAGLIFLSSSNPEISSNQSTVDQSTNPELALDLWD